MNRIFTTIIIITLSIAASAYSPITYFSDKEEPDVSTSIMRGRSYSGTINVQFVITDESTSIRDVKVFLDNFDVTKRVRFSSHNKNNSIPINTDDLSDGKHFITIIVRDNSLAKNKAIEELFFYVDNTAPLIKLASGGGEFRQGKTAVIYFDSNEPLSDIQGVFQDKNYRAYKFGKRYRAVLGFSIDDPGNKNYILRVKAKDMAGNDSEYHYKVYVSKSDFGTVRFVLKPKKATLLMPDTVRDDWKKIEDIVVEEHSTRYWSGKFAYPVNTHISMGFGKTEFINGEYAGKHRGLDFSGAKGTPIKASNSGLVRLVEYLPAHGRTVVIEHGQGIFTYYAHMDGFAVKAGDRVKKGQIIGYMGATGVATGPHLHFAMNVHNLRVDPLQWLNGKFTP